jgi:hypothetical protein
MRDGPQGQPRSVDRRNYGPRRMSREIPQTPRRRRIDTMRKATSSATQTRVARESCAVDDLARRDTSRTEVGRSRVRPREAFALGTHWEVQGQKPMTNEQGKSDRPVVPAKSPNKARTLAAEEMEGRGLAKGNLSQQNASRTPSRSDASSALERVRQAAGKDKKLRFTALLHHIYNLDTLRMAYFRLKKEAAPGVDGETWRHYGEQLEVNLQDLSERLKRGAYRAKPDVRVSGPDPSVRLRRLGPDGFADKP